MAGGGNPQQVQPGQSFVPRPSPPMPGQGAGFVPRPSPPMPGTGGAGFVPRPVPGGGMPVDTMGKGPIDKMGGGPGGVPRPSPPMAPQPRTGAPMGAPAPFGGDGNMMAQSADGMRMAGNAAAQAAQGPTSLAGADLGAYQNPYQQQVIDQSLGTLDRANQMALNNVGASATNAGAWGGSRHGVAEAETNRAFLDTAANMTAGLNMDGFNNAQQGAMFDVGAAQQGRTDLAGMSGQAFGMGQEVNNDVWRQGATQQVMNQALIDAAANQFAGFTGAPGQSLQYPLAAISASPVPTSSTTSQQPGLFNMLSLGLGLL